jgi:hypothetical protein
MTKLKKKQYSLPAAKKQSVFSTLLLLISLLLGACVEMVTDIDFPDQDPKVVVYSFISPSDTAAMVMLTWSVPIGSARGETDIRFITDAQVRLKNENGQQALLAYDPSRKIYSISGSLFPIEADKHYHLEADVPGQELVTASCFVPEANTSLQYEKTDTLTGGWSDRMVVEFSFTDPPGIQQRYYAPSAWRLVDRYSEYGMDTEPARQEMYNIYGGKYVSNKNKEGQTFLIRSESYIYRDDSWAGDPQPEPQHKGIILLLLTTDEHYYRFHKDLESYSPDNFFTEATLVYSNIKGGLGVFAGLNRSELLISP